MKKIISTIMVTMFLGFTANAKVADNLSKIKTSKNALTSLLSYLPYSAEIVRSNLRTSYTFGKLPLGLRDLLSTGETDIDVLEFELLLNGKVRAVGSVNVISTSENFKDRISGTVFFFSSGDSAFKVPLSVKNQNGETYYMQILPIRFFGSIPQQISKYLSLQIID